VPSKNRSDSPTQSWSSRSINARSAPAPSAETKTREPSAAVRDRIAQRRTESAPIYGAGRLPTTEQVRVAGSEVRQSRELDSRLQDYSSRRALRTDPADRSFIRQRSSVIYHDRPDLIGHGPRYSYIYRDQHDRVFSRLIWPGYSYPVYYGYGSNYCVRWVYPYYHRRYMFVSLGGWWPYDYPYLRYYWYGWHPYLWYGYYPVPREIEASPDNYYYTYNYYNSSDSGSGYYGQPATQPSSDTLPYGVDNETYARMQALIQKQKAGEPPVATDSDNRFEAGVESFGAGQYGDAVNTFGEAMRLAPEDKILPYAYAQALFAGGRYSEAAQVLRGALHQITPQQEGVFYPRGLYNNDDVLFGQIEQLLSKTESYELDGDLKLLLGYQLMGIGEVEYARQPLEQASQDMTNAEAAKSLLGLLDKMDKVAESKTPAAGAQTQVTPGTAVGTRSTPTGTVTGQPQNQTDSATRTNLLNKVKAMDSAATQQKVDVNQKTDNAADPNAASPTQPQTKDPNVVSKRSDPPVTSDGGRSTDPETPVEAGLVSPVSAWTAVAEEPLMALTVASLLIGGGLCLRHAGRLTPRDR
jgi:tetratricopeptide (TPR) repeat protein